MLKLASEYGVPLERCLAGTRVTPEQLADPLNEIPGNEELDVLRNILRALDPSIPFALMAGLRYHLTTHGMWGFAQLSCASVREAFEISLRYWDLSYSFNELSLEVDGKLARLVYDGSANPDDLQAALIERDLAALLSFERDVLGKPLPTVALELRGARPPYAHQFAKLFGVEPLFGCAQNCLTFDADLLEIRNPRADPVGQRISEEQCRNQLERRALRSGVTGRVRLEFLREPGEFPTMELVAERLGFSARTLHNQLMREGTSYRVLLDEVRKTLAQELLASSLLTVEQIAARVGYADTSSFAAAFKRWQGVRPGEYKRTMGAPKRRAGKRKRRLTH